MASPAAAASRPSRVRWRVRPQSVSWLPPDAPPRLAAISLATGGIATLFAPNAALAVRTRGIAQRYTWQDRDGHAFAGQLFVPRSLRPATGYPLVVQYYWCDGFLRGGQGDELPMAPLASHGIAVLCVNKRPFDPNAPDSIADYRLATGGIAAAIDDLAGRGVIDRTHVGMQGLSFGSQVTMWVASETKLLRTAAVASGQVEPASYWYRARPSNDFAARLKEGWGLDDPDRFPERWRAVTAAGRVEQIHVPLLMQLPESEARWSIELYAKLQRSPTPVELYAFPDAAHIKSLPRQVAAAYERNLAWFRFWLKDEVQIDPDDPGSRGALDGLRPQPSVQRGEPSFGVGQFKQADVDIVDRARRRHEGRNHTFPIDDPRGCEPAVGEPVAQRHAITIERRCQQRLQPALATTLNDEIGQAVRKATRATARSRPPSIQRQEGIARQASTTGCAAAGVAGRDDGCVHGQRRRHGRRSSMTTCARAPARRPRGAASHGWGSNAGNTDGVRKLGSRVQRSGARRSRAA